MDRVSFMPADHAPVPPPGMTIEEFTASTAEQLGQDKSMLTHTGRAAMSALFAHLDLRREDEVFVTTTFDYPNVSACVTSTIFNVCKPSRVLTEHTKAVFIIHEFGVPHPGTPSLREEADRRGISLIEDCAHTVSSSSEGWRVGENADWVIVSLPKILPVWVGGLLAGPDVLYAPTGRQVGEMRAAAQTAAAWWPSWDRQCERRREVYRRLAGSFLGMGVSPLFEVDERITPWFFPVRTDRREDVLVVARAHEVDCGLWHGSNVVVFPCHQFLENKHLDRIAAVMAEVVGA